MIKSEAYYRTLFIKAGQYGTAFVLKIKDDEYVVSAKHLFESNKTDTKVKVFVNKEWREIIFDYVGETRDEVDIIVFHCPCELKSSEFSLRPAIGKFVLGQDVYFTGFPYKLWGDVGDFLDGLPCPFVKKGTLSFFNSIGCKELYIDAINNEGFSGGPVLFYPPDEPDRMYVAGVVSKYRTEENSVTLEGEETGHVLQVNTGILIAYGLEHIFEIINANSS